MRLPFLYMFFKLRLELCSAAFSIHAAPEVPAWASVPPPLCHTFSWHWRPALHWLLVLFVSLHLRRFPRGAHCCPTLSCEILYKPKPNTDSLSKDALDLPYLAWDVFTAFQHSSIKPNEAQSLQSSSNRHFQLPKQQLRYNEHCLFSVLPCAWWWRPRFDILLLLFHHTPIYFSC